MAFFDLLSGFPLVKVKRNKAEWLNYISFPATITKLLKLSLNIRNLKIITSHDNSDSDSVRIGDDYILWDFRLYRPQTPGPSPKGAPDQL